MNIYIYIYEYIYIYTNEVIIIYGTFETSKLTNEGNLLLASKVTFRSILNYYEGCI
jgi:hypothetical protein